MEKHSFSELLEAFRLLDRRLAFRQAPHFNLVVCGGAALMAARWSMTQDPSEGYLVSMQRFMEQFGYGQIAQKI